MIFKVFKVDNQSNLNKLGKVKKSFFSRKKDEISIFHFQEVKTNMFHTVFHSSDEYLVGTKKIGNKTSVPFSQYINLFFFKESKYCLIEDTDQVYFDEIKKYVFEKTNTNLKEYLFSKRDYFNIVNHLGGFIKKIEYTDGEEDFERNFTSIADFNELNSNYTIDYISLNNEEYFISLYRSGKVSVSNSDEEYLIDFAEDIVNELENANT